MKIIFICFLALFDEIVAVPINNFGLLLLRNDLNINQRKSGAESDVNSAAAHSTAAKELSAAAAAEKSAERQIVEPVASKAAGSMFEEIHFLKLLNLV